MSIIQGAILGLVQGLGEFLPISSSGHVLLASMLMGVEFNDTYKILVILLHVGTLIPALIVFWNDWIDMILHPIRNKTLLLLFLASLPSPGTQHAYPQRACHGHYAGICTASRRFPLRRHHFWSCSFKRPKGYRRKILIHDERGCHCGVTAC